MKTTCRGVVALTLGLSACSPTSPKVAAPRAEQPVPTSPEAAEDPGEPVARPSSADRPRLDLSKHEPGFPASLAVPEGMNVEVQWSRAKDANGLAYEYTVASIRLDNDRSLLIEMADGAREAQVKGYRSDKRFQHVFAKKGPDGAWADAHLFGKQGQCSFAALHPKTKLTCNVSFTECESVDKLADICFSLRATSNKRVERRGPDIAFPAIEDAAAREAVLALARAFVENNHKELAKLWGPKGVRIFGKRVSQAKALKEMPKAKSARLYFRIPCVGRGEPGEPDTGDDEVYKVRDRSGQMIEAVAEGCEWQAHQSASGQIEVFPVWNEYEQPVLTLAKDRVGRWRLASVRYGNTDAYNSDAE